VEKELKDMCCLGEEKEEGSMVEVVLELFVSKWISQCPLNSRTNLATAIVGLLL